MPGGYTSHDLTHHVIRQVSMDRVFAEGQFPPRWSGELNNGFGYPVFLFNYPLPAMVGEVFHKLGLGFVDSVKAVLFISLVVSALGMYLFLKTWLKNSGPAFLGSIFYLYAPIRFINTYVSASVGSSLAMAFVPFVFWSMVEVKEGKKWGVLAGSLSLSLLVIAHNVTALMFAPLILVFALLFVGRTLAIGKMFLLGAGLSAWFWLPALFEKQYIRYDELVGRFYTDQFPSLQQLIYSPWGFGLSHPELPAGGMSYQVGLIHWLVVMAAVFGLMAFWKKVEFRKISLFALGFFAMAVLLMLKISLPVWDNLPGLNLIQYPFRLLAIAVFSASILAGLLVKHLPHRWLVFAGLLFLVLYANRNHLGINQSFSPGDKYYINQKTTTSTFGENLPRWGRVATQSAVAKFRFVSGNGQIEYEKNASSLVVANVEASMSGKLRFNQFYFPGWQIEIDQKETNFNYLSDGESYGLPVFDIVKGTHRVKAEFINTPDRNLADIISFLSVILWLVLICKLLIHK